MDEQTNEPIGQELPSKTPRGRTTVQFSVWWLVALLVFTNLVLLLLWQPWRQSGDSQRTISVSGSATLKAEPDEYVFNPSYEYKNTDKAAGLAALTTQSDSVVAGLKKIGVADSDIKTNVNSYGGSYYYYDQMSKQHTYTLTVTATAHNRTMAQKVQDYLVTTTPVGSITAQPTFSQAKQKQLESKGRDAATKEARSKADQQAKNLGFKIGKVKTIEDGDSSGGVYPLASRAVAEDVTMSSSSLAVQPGQDELTYSVQVVYFID